MSTTMLSNLNMVLTGTSSCLSIIGGALILLTYAFIPQIRNFTRRLLCYLTIADLLTAIGNLVAVVRYSMIHRQTEGNKHMENCTNITHHEMETLCVAQSFVTTFSNMASFFWTFIIAFHLWSNVLLKTLISEKLFMQLTYHVVSWVLPFVLVLIALHSGYLGEDYCYGTGVWCGIKSNLSLDVIRTWMYLEDIAWQLTCYIATCFLYIHVKFYIRLNYRNQSLSSLCPNLRDEDQNFVFVWMVIYLLKLWGVVRFFVTSYTPVADLHSMRMQGFLDFLLVLQSYGASGQAFWNSVIFCFCDKTVRTQMKAWLRKQTDGERQQLIGSNSSSEHSVNS